MMAALAGNGFEAILILSIVAHQRCDSITRSLLWICLKIFISFVWFFGENRKRMKCLSMKDK